MVNIDEAFEVRYRRGGHQFEVLVDFDRLKEFEKRYSNNVPNESNRVTAKPDEISPYDVIADTKIFKDQRRGEVASESLLADIFRGMSEEQILNEILLKGECQIPTAYLNKLREEKKKQVVNYIAENAKNPATKSRFTASMIEGEISKLKYNFDPYKGYESQAEEVLLLLKKRMPISIDKVVLKVEVPPQYVGAFYGPFRKFGKITKEFYDRDANLHLHLELTESQADKAIDFIKHNTNNEGSYHISKQ